jgi:tellurite resistance protein TehA-like permease
VAELADHSTALEHLIIHVRGETKNITGSLLLPRFPILVIAIANTSSACCVTDERAQ